VLSPAAGTVLTGAVPGAAVSTWAGVAGPAATDVGGTVAPAVLPAVPLMVPAASGRGGRRPNTYQPAAPTPTSNTTAPTRTPTSTPVFDFGAADPARADATAGGAAAEGGGGGDVRGEAGGAFEITVAGAA
jgi:hypothetical protein